MKKMLLMSTVLLIAAFTQASVIVQWGSASGETDIVTTKIENANNMPTTWASTLLTGGYTGYYPNAGTTRSPNIYGADSIASEEVDIIDNATSGDYFTNISNVSGYGFNIKSMIVWKDFLTTDRIVTNFAINIRGRFNSGNTGTLQWLVEQDGQWYISANTYAFASQAADSFSTISANISTLTWKLFTPFSGGSAVIGAAATPTLDNVTAVGFYTDVSSTGNFAGPESNYFQVQASGPARGTVVSIR